MYLLGQQLLNLLSNLSLYLTLISREQQ